MSSFIAIPSSSKEISRDTKWALTDGHRTDVLTNNGRKIMPPSSTVDGED